MLTRIKQIFQLRLALPTILLLAGAFLFFACTFDWFDLEVPHKTLFKILEKLGDLILISSVISFLIDSAEYMGLFKRELETVIYDTKFLSKRNDIEEIWVGVSKVLFQSKFPQISTNLMMAVKNYYTPDDQLKLNYYDDYRITYTVSYDSENPDNICVVSNTSFMLNVEDCNEFEFPMKYWTCVEESSQSTVETIMKAISINNKKLEDLDEPVKSYDNGMICYNFKIKLKGETKYHIEQTINQTYSLNDDNYLAFRARWLVNDMRIQLFHPDDMQILFINRATANGFKTNHNKDTFKEYEYRGLILKHQGYIIILNKKSQKVNQIMAEKKHEGDMEV